MIGSASALQALAVVGAGFLGRCPRLVCGGPLALNSADGQIVVRPCVLCALSRLFNSGCQLLAQVIKGVDALIDPGVANVCTSPRYCVRAGMM